MHNRREVLGHSARVSLMLAAAGLLPAAAHANYDAKLFDLKTLPDVAKALGGQAPVESKDVTLTGPDIAENGAVVPVGVSSALPGVKKLLVLVEKNPSVVSAMFDVNEMVDAAFNTRVKMGQSSNVYGVALLADGRVLYATKEVKVTLGGCGG